MTVNFLMLKCLVGGSIEKIECSVRCVKLHDYFLFNVQVFQMQIFEAYFTSSRDIHCSNACPSYSRNLTSTGHGWYLNSSQLTSAELPTSLYEVQCPQRINLKRYARLYLLVRYINYVVNQWMRDLLAIAEELHFTLLWREQ